MLSTICDFGIENHTRYELLMDDVIQSLVIGQIDGWVFTEYVYTGCVKLKLAARILVIGLKETKANKQLTDEELMVSLQPSSIILPCFSFLPLASRGMGQIVIRNLYQVFLGVSRFRKASRDAVAAVSSSSFFLYGLRRPVLL